MDIVIEIPKEFEDEYHRDKFEEYFGRMKADYNNIRCLAGNYEYETLEMMEKAFRESCMFVLTNKNKETKRKPVKEYGSYYCPNCKKYIPYQQILRYDYCAECGQHLDWNL